MTAPVPSSGLSAARVEEIEARANAASAGPWESRETDDGHKVTLYGPGEYSGNHESHHEWHCDHMLWGEVDAEAAQFAEAQADADFIAHARTDIPDLLAEVRRLQGELASAREETAQAVRAEQDAARAVMASLAIEGRGEGPSAWYEGYVAGQESLAQRAIAALHRRSRSLPGETADA